MSGRRVEIVIDELHVRGVGAADADAVAAALQARLGELGTDWAARDGAVPAARAEGAGQLPRIRHAGDAAELGGAVAGAVWRETVG